MNYGSDDIVMFSDSISDTVQIEHIKNNIQLIVGTDTCEVDALQFNGTKIKKVEAFCDAKSILNTLKSDNILIKIVSDNDMLLTLSKDDIKTLQIDNISTNSRIIIVTKD
mgnify:FL=1|jgi:hypothetical protein